MNTFIIAGNWKLNKNPTDAKNYLSDFRDLLEAYVPSSKENAIFDRSSKKNDSCLAEFILFPPALLMETVSRESGSLVQYGAQNIATQSSGALTGENSAQVIKEMGGRYVLVGHSERRNIFSESLEMIKNKMDLSLREGLIPVLCIGENLEQREADQVFDVLESQISTALENWNGQSSFHIAYEPVWAIGTGKVASVNEVNEAHNWIRKYLQSRWGSKSSAIQILYGGSVKPANSSELSKVSEVGGFLIGGASLEPQTFWKVFQTIFSK